MVTKAKLNVFIAFFSVLLLTSCSTIPPRAVDYSVIAGEPVIIGNYAFWNRDCSPKQFQLNIEKAPQHGDVEIVEGTTQIPANPSIGTAASCSGKTIESKIIRYTSLPEFTGIDSVLASIQAPNVPGSLRRFENRIVVRAE